MTHGNPIIKAIHMQQDATFFFFSFSGFHILSSSRKDPSRPSPIEKPEKSDEHFAGNHGKKRLNWGFYTKGYNYTQSIEMKKNAPENIRINLRNILDEN